MPMTEQLTQAQRREAADALEEVLAQIAAGELEATTGESAYLAGAVSGLRARLER